MRRSVPLAVGFAAAGLAWGLYEAQWVRFRRLDMPIADLPEPLDGFRILHLSDLHLGSLSLNARTLGKAVGWEAAAEADLVALTGDLLSRQPGERHLREALRRLRPRHGTYAVLGNHDVDVSRDPFSDRVELGLLDEEGAVLLEDAARSFDVGGALVQVVGASPTSGAPPAELADPVADLRILLAHFPATVDRLPPGLFHLLLAGHMHGGQINVPLPGRRINLLNPTDPYVEGVFDVGGTTMVVSTGLGTSLVPFRYFARPEVALLVLRRH